MSPSPYRVPARRASHAPAHGDQAAVAALVLLAMLVAVAALGQKHASLDDPIDSFAHLLAP
ncbi:MAG TPA: hypothetical protein VE987_07825 [Polyangiaceae bacterium]|nr:hypothetical protein [Polyangiaceae bacterium]